MTGIEPAPSAWKADILPLNYTCRWSRWWDSNPRLPAPKTGALPAALHLGMLSEDGSPSRVLAPERAIELFASFPPK